MKDSILKKIITLNQTRVHSFTDENNISIIKNFTNECIKIFEADYGFAWGKFNGDNEFKLAYKSPKAPANIVIPKVKQRDRKIIPIRYGDHVYGSIVLGYKNNPKFTEEESALLETIGGIIANAITINWLVENEKKALNLAEKQKETEILLSEEKIRTEFIANATHELRTPLAIMKGNVDLALMGKQDLKSIKSTLKSVSIEIDVLSAILKDMALLTSGNKNIKQVNAKSVNLTDLLEDVIKRLKVVAKNKNITILFKKTPAVFIKGDRGSLEKLFLNLIKNAVTYGKDRGRIEITISKEKNMVKIKISDDGVGISKEDLPKIFERFYRADKAHSASGIHSGLGLAIAKWAAEIHGGKMSVESTLGKGSTFTVLLPV